VWFAFDSQTQYWGGSMLDCDWKPTRQPARSPWWALVTTTMAGSSDATIIAKASATADSGCR
jgi:hypothetical protein